MVRKSKSTSNSYSKVSNLALLALIAVLGTGILLDGKLYNKPAPQQTIYPLDNTTSLEILQDNQLVWAFTKTNDKWLQSNPGHYPAQQNRVQVLLDSNKYSQRYYEVTDLPVEDLFKESVTLKINNASFEIGTVEPVSKLRYVRANNRVYLQPDTVIPLLSSNKAFVDLKITKDVQSVMIGDQKISNVEAWSNLSAIDFIPEPSNANIAVVVQIMENEKLRKLLARHTNEGYVLSNEKGFHYLLSEDNAHSAGLAAALVKSSP